MRIFSLGFFLALAILMFIPSGADAFECPKHFKMTKQAIAKAEKALKKMARIHRIKKMMSNREMKDTRKILATAKKLLAEAIRTHRRAKTLANHGMAIARADAAREFAEAADLLHMRYMGMGKMKGKKMKMKK